MSDRSPVYSRLVGDLTPSELEHARQLYKQDREKFFREPYVPYQRIDKAAAAKILADAWDEEARNA